MTETNDGESFNEKVIAEFRANDGKVGGMFEGMPIALVHHRGARSGIERVSPLACYTEDDRIYVFASKGGAPDNPAWFHNLVAHPETVVEVGTEAFPVVARVLTGAERDEYFAKQVALAPQFGEYQRATSRIIPVVELRRVG